MPRDVIMPALGMAQDTGLLVAWLKEPGDAVAEGDALFEVETDKATMEVSAQVAGYLTDVVAPAGTEVPVGRVIARISDTPENTGLATEESGAAGTPEAAAPASGAAIPDGAKVIMPALGMAQDTGLIVAWRKAPGDAVAAGDILFEVETDKSTMEVEAGHDGFVAALLAQAGEDAPVGEVIAVISADKPEAPVSRSIKDAAGTAAPAGKPAPAPEKPAPKKKAAPAPSAGPKPAPGGRVLASPKARRLAMERGLDLSRLAEAGYPQPYHVKDLDILASLPAAAGPAAGQAEAARHLSAEVPADGFTAFAAWAAKEGGLKDRRALLAGLAGASLGRRGVTVAVEAFGETRLYTVPGGRLGDVVEVDADADAGPDLRLRDLRFTRLNAVRMGAEDTPVLSIMAAGAGLTLTLECAAGHLSAPDAVTLLSNFAGRMEQPLRHLL